METENKMVFAPNGDIQKLFEAGADPQCEEIKAAIEFWGPDAGEFVEIKCSTPGDNMINQGGENEK